MEYTNNTFDDFYRTIAFTAVYGETAFFYRNKVGLNKFWAALDDTVGYWASNLSGYAYVIENEAYNMEQWFPYANWGAGTSLWGIETVIIRDNIFSDNDGSGAYLIDCGNFSV